jgi:multiple sugar transport system substrate-binding protein
MKKFFMVLFLIGMTLTLQACGGGSKDDNKTNDGSVEITFWHAFNSDNEVAITELTRQFNEAHKGQYKVTLVGQGNYDNLKDTTNAAIKSNNSKAIPDLVATYPDHVAEYMQSGAVQALDDYITNSENGISDFDDIMEVFRQESKSYANGKYLSLPLNKSTEVMYYNKTFFDENNLTVPTTWAEVKAVAQKIKDLTKGNTVTLTLGDSEKVLKYPNGQPSLGYDSVDNLFITLAHQSGGGYTSYSNGDVKYEFNNPTTIAGLQYFVDLVEDGYALIPEKLDASILYLSQAFVNELIYMNVGSIAGSQHNDPQGAFEVGVAPVPQFKGMSEFPNAEHAVIQQGTNITMLNKNTEAERTGAWEYIKFITSSESSAYFASKTGYLPIRQTSFDSDIYQEYLNKADRFTKVIHVGGLAEREAFAQVDRFFVDPAFPGSTAARDQVGLVLSNTIVTGDGNLEGRLTDTYNRLSR